MEKAVEQSSRNGVFFCTDGRGVAEMVEVSRKWSRCRRNGRGVAEKVVEQNSTNGRAAVEVGDRGL